MLEVALRLLGLAYLVGGVLLLRSLRIQRDIDRMGAALSEVLGVTHDPGRTRWLLAGAVLTLTAGAFLLTGARVAIVTQGVLVAHQLLYLVRQRRRPEEDAAPEASTVNAAIVSAVAWAAVLWSRG